MYICVVVDIFVCHEVAKTARDTDSKNVTSIAAVAATTIIIIITIFIISSCTHSLRAIFA